MKPPQATGKLEDIQMTREETERLEDCFKDKKFRDLLEDYVKEISNPSTKQAYEEYLQQVEREGGAPKNRQLMKPAPVFCIKAWNKGKPKRHVFINCCEGKLVKDAKLATSSGYDHPLNCSGSKRAGLCWQIPYVLGLKRFDGATPVYDVAFSPNTMRLINTQPSFKKAAIQTAIEAVDGRSEIRLSLKKYKLLSKCRGNVDPPIMSIIVESADERMVSPAAAEPPPPVLKEIPYRIVESDNAELLSMDAPTRPKRIYVALQLDEVSRSSEIDAQMNEKTISVTIANGKYKPCAINLDRYDVVASSMKAKWFGDKKELRLTLNIAPLSRQQMAELKQKRERAQGRTHTVEAIEQKQEPEIRTRASTDEDSFLMKEVNTKCVVREDTREDEKETGPDKDEKMADAEDAVPLCRCQLPMAEQATSSGRAFWVCAKAQTEKCTAFKWKGGEGAPSKRLVERFEVEQRRKLDKTALLVRIRNIIASTVDVHFAAEGRVLIQFETHEHRYRQKVQLENYRVDVEQSRFDVNSRNLLILVVKQREQRHEEDVDACIDDILMDSALSQIV